MLPHVRQIISNLQMNASFPEICVHCSEEGLVQCGSSTALWTYATLIFLVSDCGFPMSTFQPVARRCLWGKSQSRMLCYVNIINQKLTPTPGKFLETSVPLKTNSYHFLIYLVSRCLVKLKFQVSNAVSFVIVTNSRDKWMLKSSLWLMAFEVLVHALKNSILRFSAW